MARYELKYSEMAWWLIDNEGDPNYNKKMIGNAWDVQLLRDGPEVLIASETAGYPKSRIIPSETTLKGFGQDKDGKALWEVTDTGVIYNNALYPAKLKLHKEVNSNERNTQFPRSIARRL